jgi:hypothetical protein
MEYNKNPIDNGNLSGEQSLQIKFSEPAVVSHNELSGYFP